MADKPSGEQAKPYVRPTRRCDKCGGRGIYGWGGTVNGVPRFSGPCFACQGKGRQTDADQRRNYGYWAYHSGR